MGFFDRISDLHIKCTKLSWHLFPEKSFEAESHDCVTQRPHEAKWSHELIGGAAAYEAMKAYEDHEAREGMLLLPLGHSLLWLTKYDQRQIWRPCQS